VCVASVGRAKTEWKLRLHPRNSIRIVDSMKFSISLFVSLLILGFTERPAAAQASYGAQAYAEQQQQEERWRRISSQMEELLASQEVLRKRIQSLEEENRQLNKKLNESGTTYVTPSQLDKVARELNDKIYQVDKNRQADQKVVTREVEQAFERMKKLIQSRSEMVAPSTNSGGGSSAGSAPDKYFTHTIQAGQTISAVAAAFRKQGVKVYESDIMAANPGVDPKTLQVGQVIKIPKP
jgi:LysM repeat protein